MNMPSISLGAASWLWPALILAAALLAALAWNYFRAPSAWGLRSAAGGLKAAGIVALALCLIEPLHSSTQPRPGANVFALLADNSQSLRIRDAGEQRSRGDALREVLAEGSGWSARLGQDFVVRRYAFDTRLRDVERFAELQFDGTATDLAAALETLSGRYRGRPLAGVLLLCDGNATDAAALTAEKLAGLPPVYPVVLGTDDPPRDLGFGEVAVSQTNFEDAPVSVQAQVAAAGYEGRDVVVELLDERGGKLDEQLVALPRGEEPAAVRFQLTPSRRGVVFYQLRVAAVDERGQFERPETSREATLANNTRHVVVDRGGKPLRVLYVSGRPNWEFKFLRRALASDPQVQLVGLVRIAKREPKFVWRGHADEESNPIFRGFEGQDEEQTERYDEPVLLRLNTADKEELRDGFPKAADQLYRYHAVILDDLSADFFTQDQLQLLQRFVSQRGGGLLMLGGAESFRQGGYDRTPVGEMLPVYFDRVPAEAAAEAAPARYRLALTREGWLQPWARLRANEEHEARRRAAAPAFHTLNRVRGIKPGATVLARATDERGVKFPALVAQRFGGGRATALLVGDLWRWGLRRAEGESNDMEKAWRQTVRWLVADVSGRVALQLEEHVGSSRAVVVAAHVRDAEFRPLDNAVVEAQITTPDGEVLELSAEASAQEAGGYEVNFVPRQRGAYHVRATVTAADGSEVDEVEAGWTSEPAAREFRALRPNRALLQRIADATGGEVVEAERLERFVASLPNRRIPVTETRIEPLWHQPWMFALAIACLVGEWGLRRWKGLP